MNVAFLTFADSRLSRSMSRIESEAKRMNIFDSYYCLTERDLDKAFKKKFSDMLREDIRGFGYWCWKPQIIQQTLNKLNVGDVLLYIDVGCHLNLRGAARLKQYIDKVSHGASGILGFQTVPPVFPLTYDGRALLDLTERMWCKGDLFDYFMCRNEPLVTGTAQYGAGIIFLRKCENSQKFISKWIQTINQSIAYLDDTPSISPNFPDFIQHRHDQSIFSILCKLHSVDTISSYEYWYPKINSKRPDWDALQEMPIHAKRLLDYGPIGNLKIFIKNKIHGIKNRFSNRNKK
jgi:hypothetical protein